MKPFGPTSRYTYEMIVREEREMSRALITIQDHRSRNRAHNWVEKAPIGTSIEFKETKRSSEQNNRMWAMLTEVALQKEHCGRRYTPDQWKVLFMHACGQQVQFLPSLDGATFVPWGQSSSQLSKAQMSELIECILAWGTQNGVTFKDDQANAA